MATSDLTFQDGLKHPYLLALVRWCVSSFWTTATVILHRLITAPIPQVKASKQTKSRPASYDHLHPEPRVHCEVLHAPHTHTLDVIFVHGLYGSLGNTWRQGEWHTKYDKQPNKVALRRPHSIPTCQCTDEQDNRCSDSKNDVVSDEINEISAKSDKISRQNENNDNNDKMRYSSGEKNDTLKDRNETNDESYEINDSVRERNRVVKNDGIRQKDPSNEDYDEIYKLGQKTLKDDTAIRITGRSIARNDNISESNLSHDEYCDKNDELSKKIQDFDIRIPSSKLQGYIRDINIEKDYNCSDGGIINTEDNSNLYDNIQKILPKENLFITEKFYNNTLLDDVDMCSYETQAQFVKDLFQNSVKVKSESEQKGKSEGEVKAGDCKCEVKCEPGCGCICDDCYSPCWPKDWIRVDYPGARVISINYTSDPYLWRPLWVKESKRLRLHERAEQMMSQLLDLGVGERPIIWVGHSKGGLFIKKMYCEAYEAHLKLTKQETTKEDKSEPASEQNTSESRNDNELNHCRDKKTHNINGNVHNDDSLNQSNDINNRINELTLPLNTDIEKQEDEINVNIHMNLNVSNDQINEFNKSKHEDKLIDGQYTDVCTNELNDRINEALSTNNGNCNEFNDKVCDIVTRDVENSVNFDDILRNNRTKVGNESVLDGKNICEECDKNGNIPNLTTPDDEEENESLLNLNEISVNISEAQLLARARLWRASAGFMFYSVPHRGSPLADIKTPITARSVELMEICKDCPLVLSLQQSWSVATASTTPPVRSLVETCRTLMSVLYLRIVSVDSADPGIGSLNGVDVDHREICKPSSRRCLLYRELMTLMETALRRQGRGDYWWK